MVLALVPGPDNVFVMAQSAIAGRVTGLIITLGLCAGLLVHTTAVALGVAVIFQTSAIAFLLLKLAGALYLLYLAWCVFRSGVMEDSSRTVASSGWQQLFLRGLIMNVTNPKVALFFLAFLPQFANPQYGSLTLQIMLLGFIFMIASILVFSGIAITADYIRHFVVGSARVQRSINMLAGVVFVVLAIRLLLLER